MFRRLFRAFRARPRKVTHRINISGPERLERRSVLSAGSLTAEIELTIAGRDVQFSPAGLPTWMAGDVFLNTPQQAAAGRPIGQYEEVLTPILFDVNGDSQPDLVGTTGVATFTFFVSAAFPEGLASITTANVSYVQGVNAAGQLLVGSVGTIVEGTGLARRLSGGFTSTSVVDFYPSFSMHTAATFELSGRAGKFLHSLTEVVSGLEDGAGIIRHRDWHDHQEHRRDHSDAENPALDLDRRKHESQQQDDHLRAVDHVLDAEIASTLPFRPHKSHRNSADVWADSSDLPLVA